MGALLALTREGGRALRWPDWANAEDVLLRLPEGDAPVPIPGEGLVTERMVTGATASDYKVDQRIKVDKALTARERAVADAKAVLKAQSDATAANEKIAAALVARQAPAVKWGAGAKGATTAGAAEASTSHAQSSTPSKRYQKRNAGASKDGNANASAYKDANKSEKSPEKSKGDGAQ